MLTCTEINIAESFSEPPAELPKIYVSAWLAEFSLADRSQQGEHTHMCMRVKC